MFCFLPVITRFSSYYFLPLLLHIDVPFFCYSKVCSTGPKCRQVIVAHKWLGRLPQQGQAARPWRCCWVAPSQPDSSHNGTAGRDLHPVWTNGSPCVGGCCRYGGRYQQLQHISILFPQAIMCWCSQCCFDVSTQKPCRPLWLVFSFLIPHSSGLVQFLSCLVCDSVSCFPGLAFLLSLTLSPSLSPSAFGMLCPPLWSCLVIVSKLVSYLVWDAASASRTCHLFFRLGSCLFCPSFQSCLPVRLAPSGPGCCGGL